MNAFHSIRRLPWPGLVPVQAGMLVLALATAGYGEGERDKAERGREELSSAERERLHKVLSRAWEDKEVAAARKAMLEATDAYRIALKKAVVRIDPEAATLMSRLHEGSKAQALRHKMASRNGPPGRGGNPRRLPEDPAAAVRAIAGYEADARHLDEADRERWSQLARQVYEEGGLEDALEKLLADQERPDPRGNRREVREKLFEAMKRKDPWAAEVLDRPVIRPGRRPDGEGPPPPR